MTFYCVATTSVVCTNKLHLFVLKQHRFILIPFVPFHMCLHDTSCIEAILTQVSTNILQSPLKDFCKKLYFDA